MQVSVETTGTLGRRMTVAIPAGDVEKEVTQRLLKLAKTARLPGFRPGRAPMRVIEARYGEQVLSEVAGSLIQSSLNEALHNEKLIPAGGPDVAPKALKRGQDLEYTADFEVYPEVSKTDIDGVAIERPDCEVNDQDLERTLDSMRRQRVSWEAAGRAAQDSDQVIIDFKGTIDGEPFPGGEAENYAVVLGEGQLLKDFESGLAEAEVDQERMIEVTFPDDYQEKSLAGKRAQFAVQVRAVNQPVLPEVDADFAKSFGIEDGDVEKLKRGVRDNLQREKTERVNNLIRQRVLEALLKSNELELPQKLVEQEINRIIEGNKAMLARQGVNVDGINPDRSRFEDEARRRVALGLVLYEIVQKHSIKPDDERVKAKVMQLAAGYEDPESIVKWYYSDRQRLSEVESVVLEEQVVERLLEGAAVQTRQISFEELMQTSE